LPVALAGPESTVAAPFYEVARKVAARAEEIANAGEPVIEIS
jgi:ATP-binding protein involved in chromosome partitioning